MSLIEVLVALVIFALGMLGAGGLILSSMRSGQYSTTASVAIGLARDYGDLMQMIPPRVISTSLATTNSFTIDTAQTTYSSTATPPSPDCVTADCTTAQLITRSTWEWARRVKTSLPEGRALVCKDSTPKDSDGLYQWDCDGNGDMLVMKFNWTAKAGAAGTGDYNLTAKDTNNVVRPKMVVTLFGNQTEFVP